MFRLTVLATSLLISSAALAQSESAFSSLEERMTGREFSEAGLDKLTPEELGRLNLWIRQRSVAEYEFEGNSFERDSQPRELPSQPGERTPIDKMAREAFQTRILGPFNGSDGNGRFTLENGMVWEQTDGKAFYVRETSDPQVTIKPGLFGSWRMTVEGYNGAVRVKRIR